MVQIIDVDFSKKEHCQAVITLMKHYMTDKMGDAKPHDSENEKKLIEGLKKHPAKLCLLAQKDDEFVGLTNCFIGFGTFAAKPFINIHDIVVLNTNRGEGIGRMLLKEVKRRAEIMDCGKVTLEVRADNNNARGLYKSLGFGECNPPMHFWTWYR